MDNKRELFFQKHILVIRDITQPLNNIVSLQLFALENESLLNLSPQKESFWLEFFDRIMPNINLCSRPLDCPSYSHQLLV